MCILRTKVKGLLFATACLLGASFAQEGSEYTNRLEILRHLEDSKASLEIRSGIGWYFLRTQETNAAGTNVVRYSVPLYGFEIGLPLRFEKGVDLYQTPRVGLWFLNSVDAFSTSTNGADWSTTLTGWQISGSYLVGIRSSGAVGGRTSGWTWSVWNFEIGPLVVWHNWVRTIRLVGAGGVLAVPKVVEIVQSPKMGVEARVGGALGLGGGRAFAGFDVDLAYLLAPPVTEALLDWSLAAPFDRHQIIFTFGFKLGLNF